MAGMQEDLLALSDEALLQLHDQSEDLATVRAAGNERVRRITAVQNQQTNYVTAIGNLAREHGYVLQYEGGIVSLVAYSAKLSCSVQARACMI
jgi:hypothetical protein